MLAKIEKQNNLTPTEKAIIVASKSRMIKEIPEKELRALVASQVSAAIIIIGHNFKNEQDMTVTCEQVLHDLKFKFQVLTEDEFKNAVNMGARGEFKTRPDEVVMVSVASVYNWIKSYQSIRREAVAKIEEPEPEKVWTDKMKNEAEENFLNTCVMPFWNRSKKDGKASRIDDVYVPAAYNVFERKGILTPSKEEKIKAYSEAREKLKESLSKSKISKNIWHHLDDFRDDLFEGRPKHEKERNPFHADCIRLSKQELIKQYFQKLLEEGRELEL